MKKPNWLAPACSGLAAGTVNGLFGAGGGMILIPALNRFTDVDEEDLFPVSVSVMLPVSVISLTIGALQQHALPLAEAWPYLLGSTIGGFIAGKYCAKIPSLWLHRALGVMVLWGGFRYLLP